MKLINSAMMAVGAAIFTSAASAATVTVHFEGPGYSGANNWVQTVNAQGTGFNTGNRSAGVIRVTDTTGTLHGGSGFDVFCIDLPQYFGNGASFTTAATSMYNSAVDTDIRKLFNSAYAGISDAVSGAAFQVALWEIVSDNGSGYDLSAGDFSIQGNASVFAVANSYLSALPNASDSYALTYLRSDRYQDLVTPAPVPVPAGGILLLSGLLGLVSVRKKLTK